ncbi:hypothetical protein BGW80DRAFT_1435319 [Lactifluus volemus]|nr:hypothetical protein BGW80DRAFT_1435319 [Lactifluus volemus]
MASVFALIIGIDQYKSSQIWDLSSCVDDAFKMRHWLMNDLLVPRDHICVLLDNKATKAAIEDAFMSHLVNNPSIQKGDAIIIYFAGHGSSAIAPDEWQNSNSLRVEMLCPYDHGTRSRGGRITGLTDWSVHAMLMELSESKGDNVTLILDCCFSPSLSALSRTHTRWTPPGNKFTSDDLYAGLWRGALSRKVSFEGRGFYQKTVNSHITILACSQGERAVEDKEGGRFTLAFLAATGTRLFHQTSYDQLVNKNRILFGGTPFTPDTCYVPAVCVGSDVRILAGAIHGVVEGTEFSMHEHNIHGSPNPILVTLQVIAVHPTWSLSKLKLQSPLPVPFKVHLRKTYLSLVRWWKLRRKLPARTQPVFTLGGCRIMRVAKAKQAHISVQNRANCLSIQRHDALIGDNCPQTAIDAVANFHLHLHRRNSEVPLHRRVTMGLHRLDPESWSSATENLLEDGKVTLTHDDNSIYAVSLKNSSDIDLWPYLFWMDATGYAIRSLYLPDPAAAAPPLPRGAELTIGTGNVGSEALVFTLNDSEPYSSGFLKLFLSTAYAPMSLVEQGSPMSSQPPLDVSWTGKSEVSPPEELWDTVMGCVTVIRGG